MIRRATPILCPHETICDCSGSVCQFVSFAERHDFESGFRHRLTHWSQVLASGRSRGWKYESTSIPQIERIELLFQALHQWPTRFTFAECR